MPITRAKKILNDNMKKKEIEEALKKKYRIKECFVSVEKFEPTSNKKKLPPKNAQKFHLTSEWKVKKPAKRSKRSVSFSSPKIGHQVHPILEEKVYKPIKRPRSKSVYDVAPWLRQPQRKVYSIDQHFSESKNEESASNRSPNPCSAAPTTMQTFLNEVIDKSK